MVVDRRAVRVRNLPDGFRGLKVALLTDFHRSRIVPAALIERAVTAAMLEKPDVIVLGGDFVTDGDTRFSETVADTLGQLDAPAGVFAVMGNHDENVVLPHALARRRIRLLVNESARLRRGGDALDLIGVPFDVDDDARLPHLIDKKVPSVLLAHDGCWLDDATDLGVGLVLSGHTHGGQIVLFTELPYQGCDCPILSGELRQGGTALFVSRGIGMVRVPVRINCPSEVNILTLEPELTDDAPYEPFGP
jgi:predicted MPP superfamily phosphohydrolase